jgi:hypothetical protein
MTDSRRPADIESADPAAGESEPPIHSLGVSPRDVPYPNSLRTLHAPCRHSRRRVARRRGRAVRSRERKDNEIGVRYVRRGQEKSCPRRRDRSTADQWSLSSPRRDKPRRETREQPFDGSDRDRRSHCEGRAHQRDDSAAAHGTDNGSETPPDHGRPRALRHVRAWRYEPAAGLPAAARLLASPAAAPGRPLRTHRVL